MYAKNCRMDDLLWSYDGRLNDIGEISTAKLWDFKAKVMLKTFIEKEARFRLVSRLIDHNSSILDWGIGTGEVYELMRNKDNYVGIDVSTELVRRMQTLYPDGRFHVQDLRTVDSSSTDQVCALEVLEHIQAPILPKILLEIHRVLRPGGAIICSVPLYEELQFMTICCPNCGSLANKEGHCRSYTPGLIAAELELAGFAVKQVEFVWTSYRHPLLRIREWLKRAVRFAQPVNAVIRAEKTGEPPKFGIYAG